MEKSNGAEALNDLANSGMLYVGLTAIFLIIVAIAIWLVKKTCVLKIMKKPLLTVLLLFCISFSFAQFRNTTWGMTKERVREIENLVKERDNFNIIEYIVPMDEMNCQLLYTFAKNKLVEATYTFTPLNIYDQENIEKYVWKRTVDILNKKYGKPVKNDKNQVVWDINNFTIRAFNLNDSDFKEKVTVTYYPPMKSQQSIL